MDLSKLSTEDLVALKAGDIGKVSTEGLMVLRGAASSTGNTGEWSPQPRSMADEVGRQIGLSGRVGVKALTAIPEMVGNAVFAAGNLVNQAAGNTENLSEPNRTSAAIDRLLERFFPTPETPVERFSATVASALGTTSALAQVARLAQPASALGQSVAQSFSANLPAQIASTAAGASAGSAAAEAGAPWWMQVPISMGAGALTGMAGRKYFSQFDDPVTPSQQQVAPTKAESNVAAFEKTGVTPSAGQATGSNFYRALENIVGRFPGGQKIISDFRSKQQQAIGENVRTNVSAEDAGRAIEKGLRGDGGFMARFRETRNALYDKLDDFLPSAKPIATTRTQQALAELNADIAGAPALSRLFKNSRIQGIEKALDSDLNQPRSFGNPKTAQEAAALTQSQQQKTLPYEAIKKLRTLVGEEIDNSSIVSDVPRSKWKKLYSALSEDLGEAAKQAGPDATKAWSRANSYNSAAMKRIETVLDKVLGKDRKPEEIFLNISPKSADEITSLRTTMKSLSPAERQVVSDAVVNRLGRATPGRQNDMGTEFSTETFLTNYSKISPEARSVLFPDMTHRNAIEAVAKVATNIRESGKAFSNPSNTSGAVAPYLLGGAAVTSIPGAIGAATLVAGANIGARMLTDPRVATWLARGTRVSPAYMASHMARLQSIFEDTKDPELQNEIANYIQSVEK